jgi:hypothetical protein
MFKAAISRYGLSNTSRFCIESSAPFFEIEGKADRVQAPAFALFRLARKANSCSWYFIKSSPLHRNDDMQPLVRLRFGVKCPLVMCGHPE